MGMATAMPTPISRSRLARRAPSCGFVLLACGEHYAKRVNTALDFLKRATRKEIVVLRARALSPINHDQVLSCVPPQHFSDAQATVALKTNLHRLLGSDRREWCYLDSDVIVTSGEIDQIFQYRRAEIAFASDHTDIDMQSRHLVRCGCLEERCNHLRAEIGKRFEISIGDGRWFPWNGGVFLFGSDSFHFLDQWHQYAAATLGMDFWYPRDQGSLAAVAWKNGLQSLALLPRRFNRIVDGMTGIDMDKRCRLKPSQLTIDKSYRLARRGFTNRNTPVCVHFINDTVGKSGWKNWDDVVAFYQKVKPRAAASEKRVLSEANRIVHGLWIGKYLSKLELLTLHSFVRHGHDFHLWVYDDLATPIPPGVILEDASELLPKTSVFTKANIDAECGVGKGSFAPFSDLFRYKLLYEKGGYWVDMDVTCLRPFDITAPYVFRSHRIGIMGNLMKCPPRSHVMRRAYEKTSAIASKHAKWLYANRILSAEVLRSNLTSFIRNDICNEDSWIGAVHFMLEHDLQLPAAWYAIHWINEMGRTIRQNRGRHLGENFLFAPDKDNPKHGSLLARLYQEYGLSGSTDKDSALLSSRSFGTTACSEEHINVLLPTLNTGGAERIVLDTTTSLLAHQSAQVLVLNDVPSSFDVPRSPRMNVMYEKIIGDDRQEKIRRIAARVHSSPNASLFVHLADGGLLTSLHNAGVRTIPVVHNLHERWQAPATAFNDPAVLFVVSVSEAVARDLRGHGCRKRIVVVKHEVIRQLGQGEKQKARREIRRQLGVSENVVLLGMVGQFKKQKNYPRAVRILSRVMKHVNAKLLILGSWDTVNTDDQKCHAETLATAAALGLQNDVMALGTVLDVERYLAAFDVFLNTSTIEGLSVAMLEAEHAGCRVVVSDIGGAAESNYASKVLIPPDSSDEQYVRGILRSLRSVPSSSDSPEEGNLVPFLWAALGNYGWRFGRAGVPSEVYLVTESAASSNFSLMPQADGVEQTYVGLFGKPQFQFQERLEAQDVNVRGLSGAGDIINQARTALKYIAECGASVVYFCGLDIRVRLLVGKILDPAIAIFDYDSPAALHRNLESHPTFQHRLSMDGSAFYARVRASFRHSNLVLTA
jgi:glycosyltransferase involved in cell wall biosynthesis